MFPITWLSLSHVYTSLQYNIYYCSLCLTPSLEYKHTSSIPHCVSGRCFIRVCIVPLLIIFAFLKPTPVRIFLLLLFITTATVYFHIFNASIFKIILCVSTNTAINIFLTFYFTGTRIIVISLKSGLEQNNGALFLPISCRNVKPINLAHSPS